MIDSVGNQEIFGEWESHDRFIANTSDRGMTFHITFCFRWGSTSSIYCHVSKLEVPSAGLGNSSSEGY